MKLVMNETPAKGPRIHSDSEANGFREELDLILSHWIPNQTPLKFKADTSTAICQKFIQDPQGCFEDVAVSHVDTDGTLAALTLLHPEDAKKHQNLLESMALMGDFNAGQDYETSRWYHALRQLIFVELFRLEPLNQMLTAIKTLKGWLDAGSPPIQNDFEQIWAWHQVVEEAIAQNEGIHIQKINPHLYQIEIKRSFSEKYPDKSLSSKSRFDAGLRLDELLPRQVRNRHTPGAIRLISLELENGYSHEILLPDSAWADTPTIWKPPLNFHDTLHNSFHLAPSAFRDSLTRIQGVDETLQILEDLSPFAQGSGFGFPCVAANRLDGKITASRLTPQEILKLLAVE